MIVRVNEVVGQTRVVGLSGPQLFEDRRRFELLGVGLVGRQSRLIHGERIERGGLAIVRVRPVEALHRPLVGEHTRALIDRSVVLELLRDRGEIVALARRRFPCRLPACDRRRAGLERLGSPHGRERVSPVGHRDAPIRDRAGRVPGEHILESLAGRRKRKRMQQRHRAIERGGHVRVAGRREVHPAQLLGRRMFVLGFLPGDRRCREHGSENGNQGAHRASFGTR
jgi:hypothetical protein